MCRPESTCSRVVAGSQSPAQHRTATVQLAVGRGAGLRRHAVPVDGGDALPGFERVALPVDHLWDTARSIAALGPDAVVEAPADLREAVIRLLTDAAARGGVDAHRPQGCGGPGHPGRGGALVIGESATERLARVLALVPYISRRPGVAIADLAVEFGVSGQQISKDLDLLMVCGLPGYYPDDLIDVVLSEDAATVSITFDAGLQRPVRLTHDEAVALTVALRALAGLPGLVDADSVYSALAKLEQVGAGDAAGVQVEAAAPTAALGVVREGLEAGRQLWMRYYTASRDAVSERTVDPLRLLVTDGQTYLEAYCHRSTAIRHFRVDRIEEVRMTDEPAQQPLLVLDDVPRQMFHPDPATPSVTLALGPELRWFAEYYQAEELPGTDRADGMLRVRMRPSSDEWLVRQVLSLGGGALILDRPELAAEVGRRARAALTRYDS